MATIIHLYYKGEFEDLTVLVQIDPESLRGLELVIDTDNNIQKTKRIFDATIYDDLAADDFKESSALEFNLYLKGFK
ncbi:MAG: hypothetical protein OEX22_08495 [Cyclobacteriaceae bacterium]|nr:hypothetical protein [Cyclobacteriaceae bacterium]